MNDYLQGDSIDDASAGKEQDHVVSGTKKP